MKAYTQASSITNPTGLWLIHGDEPLIASWLLDNWRKHWHETQVERKRLELKSAKTWHEALGEFSAIGLFSSQTVVELHGNHKPDKAGLAALKQFCEQPNDNCLIVIMPTQDYKAQKTVFFKQCMQLGNVIDTSIRNEKDRRDLLSIKAAEFGIALDNNSWQMLLEQTQNNLLAAYQALWRVSDLAVINNTESAVTVDLLKPALVAQSRYNQYDLTEQILLGNVAKVVEILNYLKESGEAPSLLLWNLAKDARILSQLKAGVEMAKLPVWGNKQRLYQNAAARVDFHTSRQWADLLLNIDKAIKGLNPTPVWEIIYQLSLSMAGKSLFLGK